MTYIYGTSKVENFDKWKTIFNSREEFRTNAGLKLVKLFHSVEDKNEIHWLFEVNDIDTVRELMESDELKQAQKEAGVIGQVNYTFLNNI